MRTYRVVYVDSGGRKHTETVRADSEADALLAAKQLIRRQHPRMVEHLTTARAVPITKE